MSAIIIDEKPTDIGELEGLGRLAAPDPRDKKFALRRVSVTRTFRSWLTPGPVLDQGGTSMCVAYSGGKYALAHPVVNKLPDLDQLYKECQQNDEWPGEDYDGTSVRALMRIFAQRGMITEYKWAFSTDVLLSHLLESGPMIMGTSWFMDMFTPDRHGYIYPTGANAGGHAYLLVAANTKRKNPDGSVGAVRLINSWGPGWGQNGRAWMRTSDLQMLLDDYGEAAMPMEFKL